MADSQKRTIWQGPSWSLIVETLSLPNGRSLERGFVQHPGSVVLAPLRPGPTGPEILMLRQYRVALNETILELPAGTRGWEEAWEACAQRELREETGYRAARLTPLGEIWPAPGLSDELMKLYLAEGLTADPLPADIDEAIELSPMPLDELVTLARDGRLHDAKSVIAILRTADYLARN